MQSKIISQQEKRGLLSIGEASEYLGISIDTLRRWEKKERIIALRSPGGHRYFQKESLDNLFNAKYTRDEPTKKRMVAKKKDPNGESKPTIATEKEVEIIDWSEKYISKKAREVVIPSIKSISIIAQRQGPAEISYPTQAITSKTQPQEPVTNTLIPPIALQPQPSLYSQTTSTPVSTNTKTPTKAVFRVTEKIINLSPTQKIVTAIMLVTTLICLSILVYFYSTPQILSPIP